MDREYKGYVIHTKSCWTVNGANFNLYEVYKDNKEITVQEKLKNAKAHIDELIKKQTNS